MTVLTRVPDVGEWPNVLEHVGTPALSHDQDLKKGTNKRLMYY